MRPVPAAPTIAILDDHQRQALSLADWDSLPLGTAIVVYSDPARDEDELVERLQRFDVVVAMRERTAFPSTVLERLPRLALLASTGLRNAAIDVEACQRLGIATCGSRGHRTGLATTAETAWALILALAKRLMASHQALHDGRWQPQVADALMDRTLGLVGLGQIGQRMARIGDAFGMKVIAWSPHLTPERALEARARAVSKAELFAEADIVSLHMVLAPDTAGLVSQAELAAMKPDAVLVNTARAGLVDEEALIAALRERRIGGAGLDVFWREPLPPGHALLGLANVVLTPHLGYVTRDNLAAFYAGVVQNIAAWLAGRDPVPLAA
jgi:phosphoglycerate dehydrogenase-like enzyme